MTFHELRLLSGPLGENARSAIAATLTIRTQHRAQPQPAKSEEQADPATASVRNDNQIPQQQNARVSSCSHLLVDA